MSYPTKKLGDCMLRFDRGISWSRKDEGGAVAVLRIPNIEEGHINLDNLKYIDPKSENGELDKNDIAMVASNGNPDLVGRSALVTEKEEGMRFASFLIRLRFDNTKLLSQYAHLFLLTPTFKRELRRKIAQVLRDIKENSEINPDKKWVEFKLNTSIVGAGILSADEERRILLKLQKEGVIKLHLPDGEDEEQDALLSNYTPEEFMLKHDLVWVELLGNFDKKYRLYRFFLGDLNYWNIVNPFWWLWQLILFVWASLRWFWGHKIFSGLFILLTILAIDYSLTWRNARATWDFLISLFP